MVTLALLTETRAEGPLAKTTLGVVLVADVVVILLFTASVQPGAGQPGRGQRPGAGEVLVRLLREVLGSIARRRARSARVLSLYLRFVKRELVLFAVVVVFATAAAAQALHFELLLSLLVAGFLVENVAPVRAEPLVQALHLMAVPVFVIFFAMAGAELRLQAFAALWPLVLRDRAGCGSGPFGGRPRGRVAWPGRSRRWSRYGWTGLVSQAGVALGLATIVADRLPRIGLAMQTLIVGSHRLQRIGGPGALPARSGAGGRDYPRAESCVHSRGELVLPSLSRHNLGYQEPR